MAGSYLVSSIFVGVVFVSWLFISILFNVWIRPVSLPSSYSWGNHEADIVQRYSWLVRAFSPHMLATCSLPC